jgi:hypothetical protein
MKRLKTVSTILLLVTSVITNAQDSKSIPKPSNNPELIAVVNSANWCTVCRANGERFAALIMPYTAKGLDIYMNDLSNDTTTAASTLELKKANLYDAVTTIPRKGMGKMLKFCGLVKDKKQPFLPSGIVTFIHPKTHKQIKQLSIASTDNDIQKTIEAFLK